MKNILIKVCIVCGKEFVKPINESLKNWKNRHKFCSRKCCNEWKKDKHFSPTTEFSRKRHFIPKTVFKKGQRQSIETEFKSGQSPWNKGKSGEEYLSTESRKKMAYWNDRHGIGTPNWRGGTTKLRTAIMSLNKYKQWRTAVFKRDNYTCQKCGKRGKIQAHHKIPVCKLIRKHNIKTTEQAKNCKELWRITNGQTLCVPCHRQTDSYLIAVSKNGTA